MPLTNVLVVNQNKASEINKSRIDVQPPSPHTETFSDSKKEHCEIETNNVKEMSHPLNLSEIREYELKSKTNHLTKIEPNAESSIPSNSNNTLLVKNKQPSNTVDKLKLDNISNDISSSTTAKDTKNSTPLQISSQKLVARKTNLVVGFSFLIGKLI